VEQQQGTLSVLNVAAGDLTVSFDPSNKGEATKARAMVEKMMQEGYAILVEVAPARGKKEAEYQAVTKFDAKNGNYIIGKKKGGRKAIPAETAKATALPPRAGG
jgi:hypothetical protein